MVLPSSHRLIAFVYRWRPLALAVLFPALLGCGGVEVEHWGRLRILPLRCIEEAVPRWCDWVGVKKAGPVDGDLELQINTGEHPARE